MIGTIIKTFLPAIPKILDRVVPDLAKEKRAALEAEFKALDADLKLKVAQLEVNAREADHPSLFVAGWRPMIGWVCAIAIGFHFFGVGTFIEHYTDAPVSVGDLSELWPVVMGMLGLGGLRTYEKRVGIARSAWWPRGSDGSD